MIIPRNKFAICDNEDLEECKLEGLIVDVRLIRRSTVQIKSSQKSCKVF